ncbi:hypothetical protein ISG21_00570 [Burkholderia pseudomallei]|nr:hypothetical protein [Burkholderia pseudomallei]
MSGIRQVEKLQVWSLSLDCPHCESTQDGWVADPRGREHECDECGQNYLVPKDVPFEF